MASWTVLEPSVMSQRGLQQMESTRSQRPRTPDGKMHIDFSLDDPTIDGNLPAPCAATQVVVRTVEGNKYNGYPPIAGRPEAREAVAQYWTTHFTTQRGIHCKAENILLTCGASEAFLLSLTALCDENDNVLLPMPCLPHHQFICALYKVEAKFYRCNHEKNWEIDFDHLRSLVDGKTRAILMNNPSNTCGSNFSRQHIADLIRVCEELQLPLIADEIYAGIVFSGETFTSVADFDTPVPRFIVSGLSKRFMVPGWRFGWAIVMDRDGYGKEVLHTMQDMYTLALGPSTVLQGALPGILAETSEQYFYANIEQLRENSAIVSKMMKSCHGLACTPHQGAMSIMVMIDVTRFTDIRSDVDFCERLEEEEKVLVTPGTLFHMPNYFRLVLSRAKSTTIDVLGRIHDFCERHRRGVMVK